MSSSSSSSSAIPKPTPRRDESRVIYAGSAPPNWDPKHIRQSQESTCALLDPPVPIPDPYGWMRDEKRADEEVLSHLRSENEYTKAVTGHLKGLQEELYGEFLKSIQETDYTVPRPRGDYWYYSRTFEGSSYRQYCRAPREGEEGYSVDHWDGTKEGKVLPGEEVYLDVNVLAEGKSYCSVTAVKPSPCHRYILYGVDFKGDETYNPNVKDMETGETVALKKTETAADGKEEEEEEDDGLLGTSGNLLWGKDASTLFYATKDENDRPYRLHRRRNWQTATPEDTLLKEELDDLYYAYGYKSIDGKYLFFEAASKETSEIWFLNLHDDDDSNPPTMQCLAPKRNKVLYEAEHRHGEWWIWSNVGSTPNMRLLTSPAVSNCADQWKPVLDSNTGEALFDGSLARALDDVSVFDTHVVLQGREGGIPRVWVYTPAEGGGGSGGGTLDLLEFEEKAHDVGLSSNFEFRTGAVAITYDSLVTPPQTMELSLASPNGNRRILKSKSVPGYDKQSYACDRRHVLSRDGTTQIPISIVYRKDAMEKANSGTPVPVHLYGYGSYGACMEADFRSTRLPLLNRGVIYVIAHIRGGGEMGRQWYEEPSGAKYLCKKNTFFDFCDVAQHLVDEKITTPQLLSCEGRSAGGLTVGAAINLTPQLFRVAILGVPFVDVVATMTDASIPLTTGEWVEWGNPNEEKYFQYMMEYSPMNNVRTDVKYPSCWLTGGLHDPRVAFWEPAKFAAMLRGVNSEEGDNPICLKMDMTAGHFSASDRYKYLRELSCDYAFLLDQLGLVGSDSEA